MLIFVVGPEPKRNGQLDVTQSVSLLVLFAQSNTIPSRVCAGERVSDGKDVFGARPKLMATLEYELKKFTAACISTSNTNSHLSGF